jgi:ADP-ribose pyrophosphatase
VSADDADVGDRAAAVTTLPPLMIGEGYQRYERHRFRQGGTERAHDLLRGGRAVAVIAVDPSRAAVVLIRQFRFAAHLATGCGDLVEIVAGRVDTGEGDEAAARRECLEEIGVAPQRITPLFGVLSSPGLTDEYVTFYLASVDSTQVAARGGVAAEHEDIVPQVVTFERVADALAQGRIKNALAVVGLQWLLINRARLAAVLDGAA